MSKKETLEHFILNNKELRDLESLLAQFNAFETLNIVNAEIRHSCILAWLLDPISNHGCGDHFVKLFLKYIFNMNKNDLKSRLTIFDLETFNYSDIEIKKEWNNIDILIVSEKNKFAITIENKIGSSEHSNQLKRYFDIVSKEFPNYEKIFVYLTPEGERGTDDNWLIFDYSMIDKILDDLIEFKKTSINETILSFLEQYRTIIRRYVVNNPEIERICRDIYKKHKTALDIIFQYKPDIEYDVSQMIQEAIKIQGDLILESAGKTTIKFTSKELDRLIPKSGVGWTNSGRMLMFEFNNYEKRLALRLIIGPGPLDIRNKLHEIAKKNTTLFNRGGMQLGQKWLTIDQNIYLNKNDYEDANVEDLKEKINKKFTIFLQNDLKRIVAHYKNNW